MLAAAKLLLKEILKLVGGEYEIRIAFIAYLRRGCSSIVHLLFKEFALYHLLSFETILSSRSEEPQLSYRT